MINKITYAALSLTPAFTFAQTAFEAGGVFDDILGLVGRIITGLIPVAFGLAVLYFFYGIAKYVSSAGDPAAAAKGKSIMIYGVIAIAVMASVWGITAWLRTQFGVAGPGTGTDAVDLPLVTDSEF